MFLIIENGHAIVIDPARNTDPGEGLIVDFLIITHEHYDHISGVNVWKERYHVPLLCSETCARRVIDSKKNQALYFDTFCEIQTMVHVASLPEIDTAYTCRANQTFNDEMEFEWQKHLFRLIEIPGHSPGSIGIYVDDCCFFSGDSLLKDTEVELRFPGGSQMCWKKTGEPRIKEVPKGITIYPGHFESFVL